VFLLSAFNKTVAITPYLKTIILDHIEEHKTYQISIQMASRTLKYGPPSTFNVFTHRPNRGKGETTNGIVIQCSEYLLKFWGLPGRSMVFSGFLHQEN
jgi:hypothetical protein